eukprot:TRINITY_DN24107_c0_g1_i1.p1 TRINITY_DN24107_c0_g1~~TRINITY_DN24107_c0_g1_i1.p1  ORF type:complete len:208 (-),score=46.19 TRINITY_DN24107_c0_g1_i1:229-852(-)
MGPCASCEKAKKLGHPKEELDKFKNYYNDVLLNALEKRSQTPEEDMASVFQVLGGGNDRQITREEFLKHLTNHSYPGNSDDLFDIVDVDNEGLLNLEEFKSILTVNFIKHGPVRLFKSFISKKYKTPEQAFDALNVDRNKVLTEEEFCGELEKMRYDGDSGVIFRILDEDNDYQVTLDEFKRLLGKQKRIAEEADAKEIKLHKSKKA